MRCDVLKYWIPNGWSNCKELDGLLFFVQRMQEMLFHYSDDVHRAPIHNTSTLIYEYLSTYSDIKKGVVKSYLLEPIYEEIKSSFYNDKILRSKFGDNFIENIKNEMSTYTANNFCI